MLKEAGFKVDIHLMPDLPGSSVEKDLAMFKEVIYGEDIQADQWKIYPTSVVKHSLIEQWYNEGTYKPYSEEDKGNKLVELIIQVKTQVPPWIRLNRVIRDIPEISILGGNDDTNMRQKLEMLMKQRGTPCNCIRCREVRDKEDDLKKAELVVREYRASGGKEFFISFESPELGRQLDVKLQWTLKRSVFLIFLCAAVFMGMLFRDPVLAPMHWAFVIALCLMFGQAWRTRKLLVNLRRKGFRRDTIYGFVRLRVNEVPADNVFPELRNAGLIRELHVYGRLTAVADKSTDHIQHAGFGRRLLERAELITRANQLKKIAVISGDGVKDYYRKVGFVNDGQYLTKNLK
jgi:histone acetyltransferase (RNA polymerase elongator complex component)